MLNDRIQREHTIERALFASDWLEDREHHLPEALRTIFDPNTAESVMNDLRAVVTAQRDFFQTHALRNWSFKRPWKKLSG